MGCSSSSAQQPPASPNLLTGHPSGNPEAGRSGKRLSVAFKGDDSSNKEVSSEGASNNDGTGSVLIGQDIIAMLDNAYSPAPGEGRNKRASVVIGSATDLDTQDAFKNKSIDEKGDASGLDDSSIAFTCRKGLKPASPNQDSYCIVQAANFSMYGVFDGHGVDGHFVSNYAKEVLPRLIVQDPTFSEPDRRQELLKKCFIETHAKIVSASKEKRFDARLAGCTATLVLHDHEKSTLLVAHAGDSGCCIGRKSSEGVSLQHVTQDHKPDDPEEQARIKEGGGVIEHDGYANYRVFAKGKNYPGMNMTRALGDTLGHDEAGITAEPTVAEVQINEDDQLLLVCSDGVWEFIEAAKAVDVVCASEKLQDGVNALATLSWESWVREENGKCVDDITIIAVKLEPAKA